MNGLLLQFREGHSGSAEPTFWKLFKPIRQDLDRLYWYFVNQPWMGAPDGFLHDELATASFIGNRGMLWQPRSLGKYADDFAEEFIEFWGIEPTSNDPKQLAAKYSATSFNDLDASVLKSARAWFLYTDSTCWEFYARKEHLLTAVNSYLTGKPWVEIHKGRADKRGNTFANAGLGKVWRAM